MAGITRVRKNNAPVHMVEWAINMCKEASKNCDRFFITTANNSLRFAVCVDLKTGRSGVARCHPEDIFNPVVGKAIAYARCRGYAIPKWTTYKAIGEMKNGERFKCKGEIYTFIGYFKDWDVYSDIKIYVTSRNGKDLAKFTSFPYEKYEMVE